jgi:pyocin large subunit-like protein
MSRQALRLILLCVVLGVSWLVGQNKNSAPTGPNPASEDNRPATDDRHAPAGRIGNARETWGHVDSLPDHFARHGRDFHARDAEDYAAQAAAFLQRARTEGLPAKRDTDGSLRIYDPATGAFGAYNRNGTTRTYFKPGSPDYFERQPGTSIDLRTESR